MNTIDVSFANNRRVMNFRPKKFQNKMLSNSLLR